MSPKQRMLKEHLKGRNIDDERVLTAMAQVPREAFVPESLQDKAYDDCALPIGSGQTISQPYMVALMTQALQISTADTILEIGTGSGYQTAILAELAAHVVSIERHKELSNRAEALLLELGHKNVQLIVGDGSLGYPEKAPFDRIIVTAMAQEYPPALFDQLVEGGIMVIPLGGRDHQMLQAIHKINNAPKSKNLSACRFVPLIGTQGWPDSE